MTVVASIVPLQATVFALAALGAPAVALTRDPLRQVVVSGLYGYILAALFVVLQAPDVALSVIVVSTVAYPFVVLATIARVRAGDDADGDQADEEPPGQSGGTGRRRGRRAR